MTKIRAPEQPLHRGRTRRLRPAFLAGAALLVLGLAAPAQAGRQLENAFEDEIGRILAHEAADFGRQILSWHVPYRDFDVYRDLRGRYWLPRHPQAPWRSHLRREVRAYLHERQRAIERARRHARRHDRHWRASHDRVHWHHGERCHVNHHRDRHGDRWSHRGRHRGHDRGRDRLASWEPRGRDARHGDDRGRRNRRSHDRDDD